MTQGPIRINLKQLAKMYSITTEFRAEIVDGALEITPVPVEVADDLAAIRAIGEKT